MKRSLFHPGQRVICCDANFMLLHANQFTHPGHPPIATPVEGQAYTVRDVLVWPHAVSLTLEEVRNAPVPSNGIEPNWNQTRFAPEPPPQVVEEEVEESLMEPA